MSPESGELALEDVCRQLAEAESFEEVKSIRDKAEAVRAYAKSARLGLEMQNRAAELKLRAERRAGELLAKLKLHGGDRKSKGHHDRLNLCDLGITQNESKRWQREASLPDEEFETFVAHARDACIEISSASLIRLASRFRGNDPANHRKTNQALGKPQVDGRTRRVDSGRLSELSQLDAILETIGELRGHYKALVTILNPKGSNSAERLIRRYLKEMGELFDDLEALLH